MAFVVPDDLADGVIAAIVDAARTGREAGDGICWASPVGHVTHTGPEPSSRRRRRYEVSRSSDIAASTIWVVLAAILVIFMQAGFAFLEAGLTRMKNVGHIAAKNVLILGDRLDRLLPRRFWNRVRRRR